MNAIAQGKNSLVPVDGWDDTAAEAEARVIRGLLLKFSEARWFIGKESEPVKESRQLVAVATAAAWVRWQGGKPSEYRLREPGVPMPEREQLGDCDRESWESGSDGQPRDPWQSTRLVHLIDPHTAEAFTFSTSSVGGIECVVNLADQIKRMRNTHPNAVPLVELGAAPMKTKHGRKSKPVLRVVGWKNAVNVAFDQQDQLLPSPAPETPAQVAAIRGHDMDDDIPF
ncbi:hypothetical protein ACKWRH_32145 [Bradyrhizobium sp. Pa8]|uniref:hypothetical protein n=1 Tax=Bradyrhizobium sp. Pa8 TaxID=3386552 RepID=UPI00403F1082